MGISHFRSKHISLKKNIRKQATKHDTPSQLLLKGTKQRAVWEAGRFAGLGVHGAEGVILLSQ